MPFNDALRGTRVLAGLRLRRLWNMVSATHLWGMGKLNRQRDARRKAAPAKSGIGWLIMLCVTSLMVFSFGSSTRAFLVVLHCEDDPICTMKSPALNGMLAAMLHTAPLSDLMTRGMTMLTALLWLFSVLYPFALASRSGPDWDFEWIATLPMTRTSQLCARIGERAIANPTPWFAFVVIGAIVAWYANAGWLTPLYVLLTTAPLVLLVASIWTVLDLGLHILLAPAALRNLQAMLGLALSLVVYLVISLGTPSGSHFALFLAKNTPAWSIWTPPGLAVQILRAPFSLDVFGLYGLLLVEAVLITLICVAFLRFQLRKGIVVHGTRESGRAARSRHAIRPRDIQHATQTERTWLSPVKARELTLLLRDRRHLVQCLGLPLVMVLGQYLLNGKLTVRFASDPSRVAATAFAIGAYTLTLSALSMLATEGEKLWLLYTFPRPMIRVMGEKAMFYTLVALPYPVLLLAYSAAVSHATPWQYAIEFVLALLGLPVYAVIAMSLGVISGLSPGTNQRQPSGRYVYLFMLLSGFYTYALISHAWWQHLSIPILCCALAFALWQKASDRMPYLLDPSSAPASRVSLADGLIAAMIFIVLQFLAAFLLKGVLHGDATARVVLAYICAGAATYLLMCSAFWTLKTRGVPRILGPNAVVSVLTGTGVGLLCACVGLLFLWSAKHYGLEPNVNQAAQTLAPIARVAIVALAVFAAPVFEEFVFRGLIFGGLRRSLGVALSALGSAALFAIVHPPFSMLPVFVLGLGTAWAYERRKRLLASMITHAVYNAVVVGYQLFLVNS